jgi:hypothetical protein
VKYLDELAVSAPHASASINAASEGEKIVHLYGGALKCALPSSFADASDMRQVPDNQEVWLDLESGLTIIVELLEYDHSFEGKGHSTAHEQEQVLRRIFDDITAVSEAQGHAVDRVLTSEEMGAAAAGTPMLQKLREYPQAILAARHAVQPRARPIHGAPAEFDGVQIVSLNVRLQPVDTDLVLTLYMTRLSRVVTSNPDGILNQMEPLDLGVVLSDAQPPENLPPVVQSGVRVLRRVFETFEVTDWSLFTP